MRVDLIELLDKWKCCISNIHLKLFTVRPVMRLPMMMVIKNIMRIMMIWTITGKAFPIPVEGTWEVITFVFSQLHVNLPLGSPICG